MQYPLTAYAAPFVLHPTDMTDEDTGWPGTRLISILAEIEDMPTLTPSPFDASLRIEGVPRAELRTLIDRASLPRPIATARPQPANIVAK
ncbi:hypothetical protein FKG94_00815 [Exilibacterium tricleocarpae]|uniref:Uncharacterized protein n=1 Tax=Exilibacterium tricleocarpae TaxID=2591008 RepID=A0A545U9I5_9GAMM|nr:hypothetical protein [Exilibacterium tricleocarpae]TQV86130.1 hypothetical protein FKG94_00815 [Exilibacterium tricleocarpae]